MAIEIDDLPINSMVIFHSSVNVYRRVCRPFYLWPLKHGEMMVNGATVGCHGLFPFIFS